MLNPMIVSDRPVGLREPASCARLMTRSATPADRIERRASTRPPKPNSLQSPLYGSVCQVVWEGGAARHPPLPKAQSLEHFPSGIFRWVSCVREEVAAVCGLYLLGCDGAGAPEAFERPPGEFAQDVFELGEGLFDRVEIGAVGREKPKFGSGGFNRDFDEAARL